MAQTKALGTNQGCENIINNQETKQRRCYKQRRLVGKAEKRFSAEPSPDSSGYLFLPAFEAKKIIADSWGM